VRHARVDADPDRDPWLSVVVAGLVEELAGRGDCPGSVILARESPE